MCTGHWHRWCNTVAADGPNECHYLTGRHAVSNLYGADCVYCSSAARRTSIASALLPCDSYWQHASISGREARPGAYMRSTPSSCHAFAGAASTCALRKTSTMHTKTRNHHQSKWRLSQLELILHKYCDHRDCLMAPNANLVARCGA